MKHQVSFRRVRRVLSSREWGTGALVFVLLTGVVGCRRKVVISPEVVAAENLARLQLKKCATTGDLGDCAAACENRMNRDHEVMAPCQNACFAGRTSSCSAYGHRRLRDDPRGAIPFLEKGCGQGDVASCAGLDLVMEKHPDLPTKMDRPAVEAVLVRSCDAGDEHGCFALGLRHVVRFKKGGMNDESEVREAVPLMAKACSGRRSSVGAGCAAYACLTGTGRTPSGTTIALHNACPEVGLPEGGVGGRGNLPAAAAATGAPALRTCRNSYQECIPTLTGQTCITKFQTGPCK